MAKGSKQQPSTSARPVTRSTTSNTTRSSSLQKPPERAQRSTSSRKKRRATSPPDNSSADESRPSKRPTPAPSIHSGDEEGEDATSDDLDIIEIRSDGSASSPVREADEDMPRASKKKVRKKDMTKDLLTIFGDELKIKVVVGNVVEEWVGRWCSLCKEDKELIERKGQYAPFRRGGNSSCRTHIQSAHYEVYHARCKADNLDENPRCIPNAVSQPKGPVQRTLDGQLITKEAFSRSRLLERVAQLIVLSNLPLSLADEVVFRNCIVAARPKATKKDLPSSHDVKTFIHNSFVDYIASVSKDIAGAVGHIATTTDSWTADNTKGSFLGVTAHWIEIKDDTWKMRSSVIGFKALSGSHSGDNLGRQFVGILKRAGIVTPNGHKLSTITADSASVNGVLCRTVEHHLSKIPGGNEWSAAQSQLACLEHVVNLGNVSFMSAVTQISAIENATAMWEYDPTLPDNRVLGGSLDAIAILRTLALKIQASGQRLECFDNFQIQAGIKTPVRIPQHSNVRWGTSEKMLRRGLELREPIRLFITTADDLYGPITTLRRKGKVQKHLPWTAFLLKDDDWKLISVAHSVLGDSARVQHVFSAETRPCLWQAIPAIEELQTAWEKKRDDPQYRLFVDPIEDALDKIKKYYNRFDEKPWIILSLVLHPYYKLEYIKLAWGSEIDQQDAIANGDLDARNWVGEARALLNETMQRYWPLRLHQSPVVATVPEIPTFMPESEASLATEFDRHRQQLFNQNRNSGWETELNTYLDKPEDLHKDVDVVQWWQDHQRQFPTLARIALDVLPAQASSVPCERLFSSAKLVASNLRARLGSERFEEIQLLKWHWRSNTIDLAAINTEAETRCLDDASELLLADELAGMDELDESWSEMST